MVFPAKTTERLEDNVRIRTYDFVSADGTVTQVDVAEYPHHVDIPEPLDTKKYVATSSAAPRVNQPTYSHYHPNTPQDEVMERLARSFFGIIQDMDDRQP